MDFADSANWAIVYDQLTTAVNIDALTYRPIPPIGFNGFAFNFRYLRVTANNQNAKSRWRLGAWLEFLVDESFADVEVARKMAPVNRPAIFKAPDELDTYQLRVVVPYYFDELSLRIEGYIGTTPDPSSPFILGL